MTRRAGIVNIIGLGALVLASACASSDAGSPAEPSATTVADPAGDALPAVVVENAAIEVVGTMLPTLEDPAADSARGLAAPVVSGQSFDGSPVTLGGATSGPTLLVFLAHWCPHCNDEIPELNQLRDANELPADLGVIGISTAVAADQPNYPPSAWMVAKDWTWPVLADSVQSGAFLEYGGSGFPYLVLLDADGNVLARTAGESSAAQIKDWIETSLA